MTQLPLRAEEKRSTIQLQTAVDVVVEEQELRKDRISTTTTTMTTTLTTKKGPENLSVPMTTIEFMCQIFRQRALI